MANVLGMAFIPYYNHLVEILETNKELEKTAKGIFKQMCWGAGGALVGGAVAGPPGAMVGTIAGALMGYFKSDEYQSLITTIKGLSEADKERLVKKVQELVGSSSIESLTRFVASQAQREIFINFLRSAAEEFKGG